MWIQRKSIFVRLVQELCEGLGINKEQVKLSLFSWTSSTPDPPENCHLNVKKLPKNLLSKKLQKIVIFFKKIAIASIPHFICYTFFFELGSHLRLKYKIVIKF